MNELASAIYSRLSTTSGLTALLANISGGTTPAIYDREAAEGQALPYVVYSLAGGGDENSNPHRTKNVLVFVRAYAAKAKTAGDIDAQIDAALHLVPFTGVTGWSNTWLARETDLETVENPPTGGQVFMQGGMYRTRLAK